MNRTLRRPMFRMGGTAEGITSGLAPRQGYAHEPGHVTQGDTSKMSIMDRLKFEKSMVDVLAPRTPRRDTSMRNILIDFGNIGIYKDDDNEDDFIYGRILFCDFSKGSPRAIVCQIVPARARWTFRADGPRPWTAPRARRTTTIK